MIIRAYELKKGDVFIKQGSTYKVLAVGSRYITFVNWCVKRGTYRGITFRIGKASQERIGLVSEVNESLKAA